MASFYDSINKIYLKSVNTPEYQGKPGMIRCDYPPEVPQKYWKVDSGTVVEMSQIEKDAVDAIPLPKSYDQITTEIFSAFSGADLDQVADALDTAFDVALRKRNFVFAKARLAKALQRNKITQAQHDIIEGLLV